MEMALSLVGRPDQIFLHGIFMALLFIIVVIISMTPLHDGRENKYPQAVVTE